jgi:hypothetical protein
MSRAQRHWIPLVIVALTAIGGCMAPEKGARHARPLPPRRMRFQVVAVSMGAITWERIALDVREYTCAPGDSFGGGRPPNCGQEEGPFILVGIKNDTTAIIRYPSCVSVLRGWGALYWEGGRERVLKGPGPDTVTVTPRWRHFATWTIDGGCSYSIRVNAGSAAWGSS